MDFSRCLYSVLVGVLIMTPAFSAEIIHDVEFNFVKAQHQGAWAQQDKEIDARLADIKKAQGGKRPNILYILASLEKYVGSFRYR